MLQFIVDQLVMSKRQKELQQKQIRTTMNVVFRDSRLITTYYFSKHIIKTYYIIRRWLDTNSKFLYLARYPGSLKSSQLLYFHLQSAIQGSLQKPTVYTVCPDHVFFGTPVSSTCSRSILVRQHLSNVEEPGPECHAHYKPQALLVRPYRRGNHCW